MIPIRKIMKYSYLAKLYAESKFLFCVVCIFFAAGVGANIVRLETTPFFSVELVC